MQKFLRQFRIRETQTYELIEDVAKLRSEVGVLYMNHFNETVLRKTIRKKYCGCPPLLWIITWKSAISRTTTTRQLTSSMMR